MNDRSDTRLAPGERRRALRWGLANAVLWSIGNALTTGPLVYFLAQELGARGRQLSLLLATPMLAGLLRLFAPHFIRRAGSSKRACLKFLLASYVLMLGLPLVGVLPITVPRSAVLTIMIALICVHQLLEFIGSVALWTWLGDLVPTSIRGRYFGQRQLWQMAVLIPTILASGYFVDSWRTAYQKTRPDLLLLGYSITNGIGALCLLASLWPLWRMPAVGSVPEPSGLTWRGMLAPFANLRYARLLTFRGWLSIANGITQAAQAIFPKAILHLGVGDLAVMHTSMRIGQMTTSPLVGRWGDRYGNRPVLIICQVLVSAAMLFYLFATPKHPWILLGAWLLFTGYVGHNVCLPNLMLKLAPDGNRSPYVAAHEALSSVAHAVATVLGGELFDWLKVRLAESSSTAGALGIKWDHFAVLFLAGFLARSLAVPLMAWVKEEK